jgi:hypothetical protein
MLMIMNQVYRCYLVLESVWALILIVPSTLALLGSFGGYSCKTFASYANMCHGIPNFSFTCSSVLRNNLQFQRFNTIHLSFLQLTCHSASHRLDLESEEKGEIVAWEHDAGKNADPLQQADKGLD